MAGNVFRQPKTLRVGSNQLFILARRGPHHQSDATVAVLVDHKPGKVPLADDEAAMRWVLFVDEHLRKRPADPGGLCQEVESDAVTLSATESWADGTPRPSSRTVRVRPRAPSAEGLTD